MRIAADSSFKASLSDIKTHLTSGSAQGIYKSALQDVEGFKHSNVSRWDNLSKEVYLLHRDLPHGTTEESSTMSHVVHLISDLTAGS